MDTLDALGRALAQARRDRGLTQKELAALCGLGQSTLARFETGGVAEFGARKLLRLLEVLGYELAFTPRQAGFTLDDALARRQQEAGEAAGPSATPRGRRR